MQELNLIPPLPEELKQAALDGNLVLFVGAGASRLLGCPSWDGLADLVLESLARDEIITYGDVERLKHLEARKKLSIAHQIASENGHKIDYKGLIKHDESKSKIYSHINAIGCTYVTTNYDLLITPISKSEDATKMESPKRIYKPEQFLAGRLREPCTVVHLHGCLLDERKMILTTTQYLEHYENPFVQSFLDDMFRHHTVLFLGYRLEETEILEYVLRKGKARTDPTAKRFMLQGFFKDQQKLYEFSHNFYLTFGVHLRGYSLDKRNYLQLEYVMEEWAPLLDVRPPSLLKEIEYMEEVLNE